MEKKKKSFFIVFFNVLAVILFLVVIAVGGAIGFVYFKYKVNVFACIDQISKLNGEVNVSTLVTNSPDEADYNSINNKIENGSSVQLSLNDRELCAYLSHNLDKINDLEIAGTTLNIKDSKLEILQITLSNIDEVQPSEHYCDLNVIFKIDISSLKNEKLKSFPISLLKNFIPNELYVNANCSLDKDGESYQVTPLNISINNLSVEKTKSFFANINKFAQFISVEDLNKNISTIFTEALIGQNSIYDKLKQDHNAQGYGWQKDNKFLVYFVDVTTSYSITYHDTRNADNPNINAYTIQNNIITLQDLSCDGYNFLGWYLDVNDENTKITTIDASSLQPYDLTCKWEIIVYSITYDLRGGTDSNISSYHSTYTIESELYTLPKTATKKINDSITLLFRGWLLDGSTEIIENATIPQGTFGNRHYYAYYIGEEIELTLVVDGVTVYTSNVNTGTELSCNDLNNLVKDKLSGYNIEHWYIDNAQTNEYNYSAELVNDAELYATALYLNDCVYFYPYLTQIENAINNLPHQLTITSRPMLIGYIDYCMFYNITDEENITFTLSYMAGHTNQEKVNEIRAALNELEARNHFTRDCTPTWTSSQFYLTESNEVTTFNHFNGNVYTQQDYVLRADDVNVRSNDYDDFMINYVGKRLRVSTTEQLVWALENGYNPECVPASSAEDIYQKAKAVLVDICSDDMDEITKLQAIYKWLALHVNYDQEALATFTGIADPKVASAMARTYDSWYAEGVFNYKKAVCEGYAKALLIMAKLEGIPTICVSGNQHKWNRVYLDGKWYGIDATHGDMGLNFNGDMEEIFTYTSFLFTDAYKTGRGYTATNYTEFAATENINAYANIIFNDSANLLIENQSELSALFSYVNGYTVDTSCNNCSIYTLEVAVLYEDKDEFITWFNNTTHTGWTKIQFSNERAYELDSFGNAVYTLIHNK